MKCDHASLASYYNQKTAHVPLFLRPVICALKQYIAAGALMMWASSDLNSSSSPVFN